MSLKQQCMNVSTQSISLGVGMLAVLAALVAVVIPSPAALAQTENYMSPSVVHEERFSPADSELQLSDDDLKSYIKSKYNVDEIVARDETNPQFRSKHRTINIRGELTPKKAMVAKAGKYGLPRATAEAFLAEEGERLFGIKNPTDIREFSAGGYKFTEQHGIIVIWYKRYVGNLPLEDALIQVTAREDGTLADVTAYLVPVTDELMEAVKQETLSEAEICGIIKEDLKQPGPHQDILKRLEPPQRSVPPRSNSEIPTVVLQPRLPAALQPRIEQLHKEAIPTPPYVVWKARSVWDYTIDAFSGTIMKRLPTWYN